MRARTDGKGDAKIEIHIRKEEVVEEAAHGGSWKVAYADFITAMMAFFLLMWLLIAANILSRFQQLTGGVPCESGSLGVFLPISDPIPTIAPSRHPDRSGRNSPDTTILSTIHPNAVTTVWQIVLG